MAETDVQMRNDGDAEIDQSGQGKVENFPSLFDAAKVFGKDQQKQKQQKAQSAFDEESNGKIKPSPGGIKFAQNKCWAALFGDHFNIRETVNIGFRQQM